VIVAGLPPLILHLHWLLPILGPSRLTGRPGLGPRIRWRRAEASRARRKWGRRNGAPDGSNVSFNHGTDPNFGAVGQWGPPDIGWGGNPTTNLVSSRWTFIAYTYDVTTTNTRVYKDGQLANSELTLPN